MWQSLFMSSMDKETNKNLRSKRLIIYILCGVFLSIFYYFMRHSAWEGSANLHTLMEIIATILATCVGYFSIKRYNEFNDTKFLILGAGFLGTAFLDGYHALVTSTLIKDFLPSELSSLIPWSWVASRLFLGLMFTYSIVQFQRELKLGLAAKISSKALYIFISLLTILSMFFFALVPLPRAYYPEVFFHRPEEFIPAAFFLYALIGYYKKGYWHKDTFEHWVMLSLIVNFLSQSVFMSCSHHLFDFQFDAAHLLKKVSYIFVLSGLLLSINDFRV